MGDLHNQRKQSSGRMRLVSGQQSVSPALGTRMDQGGLVGSRVLPNEETPLQGLVFSPLLGRAGLRP